MHLFGLLGLSQGTSTVCFSADFHAADFQDLSFCSLFLVVFWFFLHVSKDVGMVWYGMVLVMVVCLDGVEEQIVLKKTQKNRVEQMGRHCCSQLLKIYDFLFCD